MSLRSLLAYAHSDPAVQALAAAGGGPARAFCSASMRPYLLAALLDSERAAGRPALAVVGDDRAARDLAQDLKAFLAPRRVRYYPSRGVRYESHLAPPPHLVGLRIGALDALLDDGGEAEHGPPVVVISAVALSEKVPDPELRPRGLVLRVGEEIDLEATLDRLVACGYERTDQVDERGQFAVRGGILDLYPATEERAVRCELFGDEVERLSFFSTFTQRSLGEAEEVEVAPAAELAPQERERAEQAADAEAGARPDIAELLPLDRFHDLFQLLGSEVLLTVVAEEEVAPALADHWQDVTTSLHSADAHRLYLPPEAVQEALGDRASLALSAVSGDQGHAFRAQAADLFARNAAEAEAELEKLVRSGYRTVVAWPRRGDAERAQYNLARVRAEFLDGKPAPEEPSVRFAQASLRDGFLAPALKLAVLPEHRLLRRRRAERPSGPARGALRAFTDLRSGDYVVHSDHGVARFEGFDTKTVAGVTRDYLYLQYRDQDRVFVPSEQLAKISRYIGADGSQPQLSKLGGKAWETLKARARHAAEELAGELIDRYAERRARKGHAFGPDGEWQVGLEQAFPYRETPDQLDAIEETKADMESEAPMDRLICGDVGYGKTEVALRAAFKAASAGKQVMMLVPTTILAEQHFGTFAERMADYPIRIEMVSRFRSRKQAGEALEAFSQGSVEILIGTHRLLSADVMPKDLGLLIVDEEQRFGVKQKELLQKLKRRVDVLSLSATPIPRTLQMSLAGLRDISVIESPPEGRRPVRTYVGAYDEDLVKAALEREQERGGQAFFLHNRVETIDETAERVRALCPQLRILVAHGQMEERELEETMLSFLRGAADCLVCTSIIESGLDIPQANTLVIERADQLGLAQLYQVRGRVGRAKRTAYAYLMYPSAAALTPEASARLSTLSDYTELGSGFKIAMRDLEIRGAGNLLGTEQSGHVAAVGFELYMDLLDRAVAQERAGGEAVDGRPEREMRLDLAVDAHVPGDYVGYEAAKMDVHRRVAQAHEPAELGVLREELRDRFGPVPEPVSNLIRLQEARIKLGRAGAATVQLHRGRLTATPLELDPPEQRRLRAAEPQAVYDARAKQVSIHVAGEGPGAGFDELMSLAEALAQALAAGDSLGAA